MAAHLFGYVGEVSDAQVAGDDGLKSGDIVGQSGIEKIYNALLMGEDGAKRVVVNSVGREIRTLDEDAADRRQAAAADDRLRRAEGGRGRLRRASASTARRWCSIRSNGEVLGVHQPCRPTTRTRSPPASIARRGRRSTPTSCGRCNDRAIQGRYSPGLDVQDGGRARRRSKKASSRRTSRCTAPGHANFYGRDFKCWKKGGHGTIDLRHAIEQSCDVYFYTVGNMVGVDKINKWATALGLGVKSGIDLPNEVQGLVPSTEWKREQMHEKWYAGETISVGDRPGPGVGDAGVDGGLHGDARQRRHARHAAPAEGGRRWQRAGSRCRRRAPQSTVEIDPEKLQAIRDGLWMVVNGARHRRHARGSPGYDVVGQDRHGAGHLERRRKAAAGKTDKDLRDNGWFVFFAPRDNPQIAGVVFLEHGVHGANAALDRAPRPGDVLREEGRAAAAACRRQPDASIAERSTCRRMPDRRVAD